MVNRRGQTWVTTAAVLTTTVCLLLLTYVDVAATPGAHPYAAALPADGASPA
ncbi:hypothetical protein ACFWNK_12390 [Streptomyces sp. NPDC058417]|uniref:hypothetical protein n=1 Tax=unclassified Streptomyces TaxID=2593676 RepID=UPI0036490776